MPLIETAGGMSRIDEIARTGGVTRLALGHIDLQADLGMACGEDEAELAPARWTMVVASRRAGLVAPVDGVTVSTSDFEAMRRDALRSRRYGFRAKLCIHPAQVPHLHAALSPTEQELAWALRVLKARDVAAGGAFSIDGKMVDAPVIRIAEQFLLTSSMGSTSTT